MIWTYKTTVDLDKPNKSSLWETIASVGNKNAHGFEIHVVKSGVPVDLSGSKVHLFAKRQDGATRHIDGKISNDNAAVAELDETCYEVEGELTCTISIDKDDASFSAACIYFLIGKAYGDAIVDPSHTIPSLSELLAQIEITKSSAKAAQDAAGAANAAAGSANTAAGKAGAAAAKIDNMTVSATSGTIADASVSEKNGAKHIAFVLPQGEKGDPGNTPYIGGNGNWWVGDEDTGTKAQGPAGQNGTGAGTVTAVKVGSTTHEPDATGVVNLGDLSIYAPVRGTDYWTEADIAQIRGYVDDAILGGAW